MSIRNILKDGAESLGLALSDDALQSFEAYAGRLTEKNRVMNLTAITEEDEVARLHFLDSLSLLPLADFKKASVIDVGSGAGFPGLPLKLAEPTISLTLLDAQRKRVDFLRELCGELGTDVTCVHARAEEAAELRESFDFALSRAVARLNVLCELCLPLVKTGGLFIAMKSVSSDEETAEAARAIRLLGGEPERTADYRIPGTDVTHRAILIRKVSPTPAKYPRRFAKIQKEPL